MSKRGYIIAISAAALLTVLICFLIVRKYHEPDENTHAGRLSGNESTDGDAFEEQEYWTSDLTDEDNRELLDTYKLMKEDNPDFAGYFMVEGTQIAYPVMYSPKEPEKYIHKDFNGLESDEGLPFIDTRCKLDPDSDNVIIYGHNMKDGSMFASLISYQDRSYFEAHPRVRFDTADEVREYEVMSVFYDRVYYTDEDVFKFYDFTDAKDESDFDENVAQLLKKSVYDTKVTAHYGDKLVTLVTCAYHTEDGRFVVVAKRCK